MALGIGDVRQMALAFPEAHVQDHHGFPSFRVGTKIFATLPDEDSLNVMLAAVDVPTALSLCPGLSALHWGQKLCGVRVTLATAEAEPVSELLAQAWRRVATKKGLAAAVTAG